MKLLILAVAALATVSAASIPVRERAQDARIIQGVRSGSLTPREAARLDAQAHRVHRGIQRDRIDGGRFTPAERRDAHQSLNHLSRQITRSKLR